MEHLSITFPHDLRLELDKEAKREHTKRSTLIQKAVRLYLGIKEKRELCKLMKEGYLEMASESREITEAFKHADTDMLKYVD